MILKVFLIHVFSGPAIGVVAGTKIPNYCVMSETADIAREIEKQGEGMRILLSQASKQLLDKVGGFRCEPRGTLNLAVSNLVIQYILMCGTSSFVCRQKARLRLSGWLVRTIQDLSK